MSNRDCGGPAFPIHPDFPGRVGAINAKSDAGMTLRDYFAAHIASGLVARCAQPESILCDDDRHELDGSRAERAAIIAYEFADAMLEERDK